jgi:hypothetical protein
MRAPHASPDPTLERTRGTIIRQLLAAALLVAGLRLLGVVIDAHDEPEADPETDALWRALCEAAPYN